MTKRKTPAVKDGDFYQVIDEAMAQNRYEDYLKQVLVDYEEYKKVFAHVLPAQNSLQAVYIFRFKYTRKLLWREIAIFGHQTLLDLAETLIAWMNFANDHMHGFSLKTLANKPLLRYNKFSIYAPYWEDDPYPTLKTNEVRIADVDWQNYPKWNFIFDFGDGHEFDLELRKIIENPSKFKSDLLLPTCIDQRGVAPLQYPPLLDEII
jgi:hypothetical protein